MSSESPTVKKNLVSIICRTLGRPELQEALRSIASQDYPNIEIVLVDAAGDNSLDQNAAGDRPVALVSTGKPLSRSQSANAGLDAAQGKYVQFLDDDDWIATNHVSQLVSALQDNKEISAAYSSTQKTSVTGDPLDYLFNQEFDPILLMRDNYIPIHAILFDRSLLDYRADNILGKGRIAIFKKWLPKWTAERMNLLIGQLDQSALLSEKDALIQLEMRKNAKAHQNMEKRDIKIDELNLRKNELDQQINGLDQQINGLDQQIHELDQQVTEHVRQIHGLNTKLIERDTTINELNSKLIERDQLISELDTKLSERIQQVNELENRLHENTSTLQQLQLHSDRQSVHISELESSLNAIYNSKSWKLMGPVRRAGRILWGNKNSTSGNSDSE